MQAKHDKLLAVLRRKWDATTNVYSKLYTQQQLLVDHLQTIGDWVVDMAMNEPMQEVIATLVALDTNQETLTRLKAISRAHQQAADQYLRALCADRDVEFTQASAFSAMATFYKEVDKIEKIKDKLDKKQGVN